jgi:hypothetical protein
MNPPSGAGSEPRFHVIIPFWKTKFSSTIGSFGESPARFRES